jgi:hypothetical protein
LSNARQAALHKLLKHEQIGGCLAQAILRREPAIRNVKNKRVEASEGGMLIVGEHMQKRSGDKVHALAIANIWALRAESSQNATELLMVNLAGYDAGNVKVDLAQVALH